jgi:PAS domain-containing protein
MQGRMAAREKNPNLPPPLSFAPLGQAVMETFGEGVVVFDPYGRMLYANQRARRTLDALEDGAPHRGERLRERLMAFGGRARTLRQGSLELGEVVFLPDGGDSPTLAERERQAILDTLEVTHGKLAEAARRLGISRTTLWRRLRAYGLRPNGHGGPEPATRV